MWLPPTANTAGAVKPTRNDARAPASYLTPTGRPYGLRATDWTESLRDLVTTILETNIAIQGNRMNLVMKKVTSWAAIIAVPTAITGFYGQNVPYPGFAAHWGFWFSSALIVLMSGSLYWAFRRNDWI